MLGRGGAIASIDVDSMCGRMDFLAALDKVVRNKASVKPEHKGIENVWVGVL